MNAYRLGFSAGARRAITFVLCALLGLPPAGSFAQPIAAGTTNTQVLANPSGNGVPSVNIAAPNAAGLSHNQYQAFNVGTNGLVLNNATAVQQSQLAGMLQLNPNLAGRSASVILNEVIGPNRSVLQGYTEVHGAAAELVIANPYGITCSGCGFINTPRATLSTGVPEIDASGNLYRFRVSGGDILINGAGLDATGANYFDLVARQVKLDAPVYAKDLGISGGAQDFAYATRTATPGASGPFAGLAIDSSALGGMYADRIRLIANEAGVGVRLLGDVAASVDDIVLNVAGRIELAGQVYAARDLKVASVGSAAADAIALADGAQAHAARDATLDSGTGGVTLGDADVGAQGALAITGASVTDSGAGARYSIAGSIAANVTGAANLGSGAVWDAAGGLAVQASSANLGDAMMVARGAANALSVDTTGDLSMAGATLQATGDIALRAGGAVNVGANSQVFAGGDTDVGFTGSLVNEGTVAATGDVAVLEGAAASTTISNLGSGVLSAGGTLTVGNAGSTAAVTNAANASMLAGTQLDLEAGQLTNSGTLYSAGGLQVDAIRVDNALNALLRGDGAANVNATKAPGASGLANRITNEGNLQGGTLALTASDGIDLGGAASQVYATGDLSLQAPRLNIGAGTVYATGNLAATTGTLADSGGAGALRAAGGDMTLEVTNGLVLGGGQQYDARGTLKVQDTAHLALSATPGDVATTMSAGTAVDVTVTGGVVLGNGGDALQGLPAAGGQLVSDGAVNVTATGIALSGASGLQAAGSVQARFDTMGVGADASILANGNVDLGARTANPSTLDVAGTVGSGSTLLVKGNGAARNLDATVRNGGLLAGYALDMQLGSLSIEGASGTSKGRVQGGAGTGTVNLDTLDLQSPFAEFFASDFGGTTTINIAGDYTNKGRLYGQGDVVLNSTGNVVNQSSALLGSVAGSLSVNALGNIDNSGLFYAYGDLDLITSYDGLLYNRAGAEISTGAGGTARLGLCETCSGASATNTVKNEGQMHFGADAGIHAYNFQNNIPLGGTYFVLGSSGRYDWGATVADSGRYANEGAAEGWDTRHWTSYASVHAAGFGLHDSRPDYRGSGVTYYHVRGRQYKLLRDFYEQDVYHEHWVNPGAAVPVITADQGTLTIETFTGENKGGSISGYNLLLKNLVPSRAGSSFTNEAPKLQTDTYTRYGRAVWDCFGTGDAACTGSGTAVFQGNEYLTWSIGTANPSWGFNDSIWRKVQTVRDTRASVLAAANSLVATDFDIFANIGSPQTGTGQAPAGNAATVGSAGGAGTPPPVNPNGGTPVINGVTLNLPTSPNGMFLVSGDPASRYLVETNPIFIGEQNPFLGSDYLAGLLGLDPDKLIQRLGDANYENRLIREQLIQQTGASLLRSASTAFDQEKQLLDNANLEAKELRLNFGVALTAEQVAALKHDIVWMVEQEVQGRKVLVPVVYLSTATRASLDGGATIQATNVVVTGDSFLNRGGTTSASGNLAIVTRKDIVNSSGTLMGGKVQLQSKEGSIINRTETFREGDGAGNYTTFAGKMGGIFASESLFAKAAQDIDVEGAAIDSGGTATLVAGNNINVTSLVLEARDRVFSDTSGTFNRDVSDVTTTTQTAQTASITSQGDLALVAKNDINLTGAVVGSAEGQALLISEEGNVNLSTLALTNTRREDSEHIGFFAESGAGKKQDATGTPQAGANVTVSAAQGRINALTNANKADAKLPDPETTSAGAFTGLAVETKSNTDTSTTNVGSVVSGNSVAILAKKGDVNITGSQVEAGEGGGYIEAGRDVNVMAAYDTSSSTRNESSTRIGVAAEANADGAYTGFKVSGSYTQGSESSRTASVSQLNSGGSMTIIAGNKLTNEGTKIDAAENVNIKALEVENLAARNESSSNIKSSSFEAGLMVGVTTNGMGQSIANLAQGTGKDLTIAAPESQVRLAGKGQTSESNTYTNTAVVTEIKAGGSVNMQVKGRVFDEGTSYDAGKDINISAGSYENRQATDIVRSESSYTSASGKLTVGVDATRSANANLSAEGSSGRTTENSSTAVVGKLNAGGNVNIRTTGDATFQGTAMKAGTDINVDAGGNLNLLQANNTVNKTSDTTQGSANASASLCVDLSCASAGVGASARTVQSSENSTIGVAGTLEGGRNVNLRSGGNMTLQGTEIKSGANTSLDAGGNIDFQALSSTVNKTSSADGGGANLNANVGASGKIASDGGGGGSVNFERGRTTMQGEVRQGGSVAAGGQFSVRSGGNTRLEGTQVQASTARVDVAGNFTMESAQSTVKQDSSSVTGSVAVSAGKSADGGRNFGGSVGFSSATDNKDNVTNQNASLLTSGGTVLNVGGNATLAGANIDAAGGVSGRIAGDLKIETRADQIKEDKTNVTAYVGVGNMQLAGKNSGPLSRSEKVDQAQDRFGNVANAAAGTGVFINAQSDKKDNLVVTRESGISNGGIGSLQVGGNATLTGASAGTQSALNVAGTTTVTQVETRVDESKVDFQLRGTVASAAGSDQGSGGQFNNLFQASGGKRPDTDGFTPGVTPQGPRRPAGEGGIEIGGQRRPVAGAGGTATPRPDAGGTPVVRPRSDTASPLPRPQPVAGTPVVRPRTGSEPPPRPETVAALTPRPGAGESVTPAPRPFPSSPAWAPAKPTAPAGGLARPTPAPGISAPVAGVTRPAPGNESALPAPKSGSTLPAPNAGGLTKPTPVPGITAAAPGTQQGRPNYESMMPAPNAGGSTAPRLVPGITAAAPGTQRPAPAPAGATQGTYTGLPSSEPPRMAAVTPRVVGNPALPAGNAAPRPGDTPPSGYTGIGPRPEAPAVRPQAANPAGARQGVYTGLPSGQPEAGSRPESSAPRVVGNPAAPGPAVAKPRPAAADGTPDAAPAARGGRSEYGGFAGVRPGDAVPARGIRADLDAALAKLGPKADRLNVVAADPGAGVVLRTAEKNPKLGIELKLKTVDPHYVGEDQRSNSPVKYLTPQERASRELEVVDGVVRFVATKQPFSTGDKTDGAIFVVDADGRIFASTENKPDQFHHSSLTGGEPVAAAGHVVVLDGKVVHLNNFSGHYKPDGEMLDQALLAFGVRKDDPDVRIVELTGNGLEDRAGGKPEGKLAMFDDAIRPDVKWRTDPAGRKAQADLAEAGVKVRVVGQEADDDRFILRTPDGTKLKTIGKDYLAQDPGASFEPGQGRTELELRGGLLYRKDDGQPFDTRDYKEGGSFVIDAQGRIFATGGDGQPHAGLANGKPVSAAGHIVVEDGRLLHLNNLSPHYQPDGEMLKQAMDRFGVAANDPVVRVVEVADGGAYDHGTKRWLRQAGSNFDLIGPDSSRAFTRMVKADPDDPSKLVNPVNGVRVAQPDPAALAAGVQLTPSERNRRELVLDADRRLVFKESGAVFDTGDKVDGAMFVVDASGRIFASTEEKLGVRHGSLALGDPVAAAGRIVVRDGKVVHLNNASEDYRTDGVMLNQVVGALGADGARLLEVNDSGADPDLVRKAMEEDTVQAVQDQIGVALQRVERGTDGRLVYETATGLRLKGMDDDYKTESGGVSYGNSHHPNWQADDAGNPKEGLVQYYRGAERDANQLVVRDDGRLVYAADPSRVFDTGDKADGAIFVIDPHGRMYATTANEPGRVHHSSLTAGEPVALAGHVVVRDGKLLHINNISGHYRPDREMLAQGVRLLSERKLDLSGVRVIEIVPDSPTLEFAELPLVQQGGVLTVAPGAGNHLGGAHPMQPDVDRGRSLAPDGTPDSAGAPGVPTSSKPASPTSSLPGTPHAANDAHWRVAA